MSNGAKGLESFEKREPDGRKMKEEGDAAREYKTMHEENFLTSWLREDGREKEELTGAVSGENEEGTKRAEKKGRREN